MAVELGIAPGVLAETDPILLEALAAYLEVRRAEQRAEELRQRLRTELG